jgi:excisionase family DNA binding protein
MENNINNLVTILNTSDLDVILSSIKNINDRIEDLLNSKEAMSTKYLSSEEVCETLQISSRTLQKYRDEGRIRFAKLDRKIIYKESDIDDFVESNMNEREI